MPNYTLADQHAKNYTTEILQAIDFWLATETGTPVDKTVDGITFHFRVIDGSLTKWFLEYLKTGDNLKHLLKADMDEMLSTIDDIRTLANGMSYEEQFIFFKFSKTRYLNVKHNGKKPRGVNEFDLDHFNYILHDIFITHGYEAKVKNNGKEENWFKKDIHVRSLHQRICPYCGRSYIFSIDVTSNGNSVMVKPQIDHYLPKSIYPWFAMTYFNLIPVCIQCNHKDCKGNNDPLTNYSRPLRMIYPYEYDDRLLKFEYELKGADYNDARNFKVRINYNGHAELEDGSRNHMMLDEFYKHHDEEVKSMYMQMMVLSSGARQYYRKMEVPANVLIPTPQLILGYRFSAENSQIQLLYKFRKDIYRLMTGSKVFKHLFDVKPLKPRKQKKHSCLERILRKLKVVGWKVKRIIRK